MTCDVCRALCDTISPPLSLRREWLYASDLLPQSAGKLFERYAAQFKVEEDVVADPPRYEGVEEKVPSGGGGGDVDVDCVMMMMMMMLMM